MQSSGWQKLYDTDISVAQTAPAVISATRPSMKVLELGLSNRVQLRFFGTDGDGDAAAVGIYLVDPDTHGSSLDRAKTWYTTVFDTISAVTLGTETGISSTQVDSQYFFADTIATITAGFSADLGGNEFETEVHEPANDIATLVYTGAIGSWGMLVLFTALTTAASMNVLYKLDYIAGTG